MKWLFFAVREHTQKKTYQQRTFLIPSKLRQLLLRNLIFNFIKWQMPLVVLFWMGCFLCLANLLVLSDLSTTESSHIQLLLRVKTWRKTGVQRLQVSKHNYSLLSRNPTLLFFSSFFFSIQFCPWETLYNGMLSAAQITSSFPHSLFIPPWGPGLTLFTLHVWFFGVRLMICRHLLASFIKTAVTLWLILTENKGQLCCHLHTFPEKKCI